jgi:DNA-binding LacI/PurR family transcriptional regulator
MAVRLKDVAAHAGVSVQTVSNVIHGNEARVSAETRRQVLAAIESLGYRPNAAARFLRRARAGLIALAIPDLVNPYYADLGSSIVAEAAAHGYTVLLDHTRFDHASEVQIIRGLLSHAIDGVILDPQALLREDLQVERQSVPVVLLGEKLLDAPCDHVAIDNVLAARAATRHLLHAGRRRIAAVGVDARKPDGAAAQRLKGFSQALGEAGLSADPALLIQCAVWSRDGGAEAVWRLLALPEPPDALFCFNDVLALGAMRALYEAGHRVPDDVAVVGFDDIEEARFATPSLTTIAPDKGALARIAVSLLMGRIDGSRTGPPEHVRPAFSLRVRESSGPKRVVRS